MTAAPISAGPALPRWRMRMGSNVSLVMITAITITALRLPSTIVLTRLLSPEDFGVTAITAAIVAVLVMVSDLGFGVFIIQHGRGDDARFLDVVWTVRLLRSAVLTAGLAVLARPLAVLIGQPEMTGAIAATSLFFLIEGLSSLAMMTVVREQKLLRLSLVDVASIALQICFCIALAYVMRSYWAIVIGTLLGAGVKTGLSYAAFPGSRRRLAFDRPVVAELWRFGRNIMGAHTIQVMLSQVDKFVLARLFPLDLFGIYSVAQNLAGAPSSFTTSYPNRVLLPAYSQRWREAPMTLRDLYYDGRRRVMQLYLAAMGVFIGFAPAVVQILYDPRYAVAGDYLGILAIAPLVALNNYAAREVLIAIGQVRPLLIGNFVRLGWLAVAGTAGFIWFGATGLVVAVGTIEVPVQVYNWGQLRRNGLLRVDQELMMLGVAGAAIGTGAAGNRLFAALFG